MKEWRMVEEKEMESQLEQLELDILLVEKKDSEGEWPRRVLIRAWNDFRIGDVIDCKDSVCDGFGE